MKKINLPRVILSPSRHPERMNQERGKLFFSGWPVKKQFSPFPMTLLLVVFLGMLLPYTAFAGKDSIKLRVVAVNPSKAKPQKVPIKIYLPKEVIPDDIIEMKDLKVAYDSSKSLYYAYNDGAELQPQETRVFEVRLEDVWKVPKEETSKIKIQTDLVLKRLEKTEHAADAKAIVDSIDRRLKEVVTKQEDEMVSREDHIGVYRTNLVVMDGVKQDIAMLEKMLVHSGGPPSIEFLKDTVFESKKDVDKITAWKLILGIIGFLGLLGFGFYFRWLLMIKARKSSAADPDETGSAPFVSENVEELIGLKAKDPEEINLAKLSKAQQDKRKAG